MSGFSNEAIKAANPSKPHIVKIDGLWRVSPLPRCWRVAPHSSYWLKAHNFACKLNQPLLDKMFSKEKKND